MEPKWLSVEEQRTWRAFVAAHGRLLTQLDLDLLSEFDLTLPEYEVMAHLSEATDWQLRMNELAELCALSPSGLTRRFDSMVRSGLVTRRPCDDDRRGVYAALTQAGYDRLSAAAPAHLDSVRRHFIEPLGSEHLELVERILDRIAPAGVVARVE